MKDDERRAGQELKILPALEALEALQHNMAVCGRLKSEINETLDSMFKKS